VRKRGPPPLKRKRKNYLHHRFLQYGGRVGKKSEKKRNATRFFLSRARSKQCTKKRSEKGGGGNFRVESGFRYAEGGTFTQ